MKKNKLFIILLVVTILTFLGTAATCNLCGLVPPVETTSEESEEEVSEGQRAETTTAKTEAEEEVAEETEQEETYEEEVEEETLAEETATEESEEESEETSRETFTDTGGEAVVSIFKTNKNLSGYVTEDGSVLTRTVFIGDNTSKKAVKGYISFDVRDLLSSPITSAELNITNIVSTIDEEFARSASLDIKVYYYGDSLDAGDFARGGTDLASLPAKGLTSINISSTNLKNLLEQCNNDNKDYFQLKLGLSRHTDNDDLADMFAINLDAAKLIVE